MAKKPKAKVRQQTSKNLRRNLLIIPSIVLLAKFIWIAAMPGHGLLGADGENYLSALDGLIKDGFTSDARNLHYWPAGYPNRKSTRLNSSHIPLSRMPSSA